MKTVNILLVIVLINLTVSAQQLGIWKNYSNMKSVVDARLTENGVWAATKGGAFFYDFNDKSFLQLTKDKGLSNNSLTSMVIDNYGKIWFGSEDGAIDVYDPVKKEFVKRILELYNSNKTQRKVNNLRVQGDTVFAATDFGLSLIDSKTYFFLDTYLKFGSLPSDTKVRNSFTNNVLYVMTENGLAVQKEGATNLSAPESWNNLSIVNGLPSNALFEAINYAGTLIVSTDKGLAARSGETWVPFLSEYFNNVSIADLEIKDDTLLILTSSKLWYYVNGNMAGKDLPAAAKKVLVSNDLYIATENNGIMKAVGQQDYETYVPDGPASNFFPGIAVDKDGNLWSGSGSGIYAVGFYKYDGEKWTNYTKADVPGATLNTIYKIYVAPDNTKYFMNFGDGFYRLRDNQFQIFNASNTDLTGIPKDLNYVVISGLSVDSKGNLWILTYGSESKQPLSELKTDSTWQFIPNSIRNEIIQGYDLVIDQYDTKWMIVGKDGSSSGEAIYYYNEKPLTSSDINGWGVINTEDGLNSGTVNAIALDRRGELWVGTGQGLNIISDTRRPNTRILTVYTLRSQVINTIAVDALNQKWVGTQQGVFLLSPDGTKLLASYNTTNSPLPSDIIKSIAIDHNSGTVYFGTDYGLTSLTTSAVNPVESFAEIFIYPNPVVVTKGEPVLITIDGLIRDSEIKILNISGKVINTFSSPGGRIANWDGKDSEGNNVPSGIYLIIAYDQEGNSVASSKVAILNK